jgi:hypothetical protein
MANKGIALIGNVSLWEMSSDIFVIPYDDKLLSRLIASIHIERHSTKRMAILPSIRE